MTRIILFSGVLALSFFLQGAHASEAERALREKISKVQRILQDPELKGETRSNLRRSLVREVIEKIFDTKEMARLWLGRNLWRAGGRENEFYDLFGDYLESIYMENIEDYADFRVEYKKSFEQNGKATVYANFFVWEKGAEESALAEFFMHFSEGEWKVYDIRIEYVSLALNYEAQYERKIRLFGFDILIREIREKIRSYKNRRGARLSCFL